MSAYTTTGSIKKKVALWAMMLALAIAASLVLSQAMGTSPTLPQMRNDSSEIQLLGHRNRCDEYKKGSRKRRACKEDCGFGAPGRYGQPPEHPNHPRQCRNQWPND